MLQQGGTVYTYDDNGNTLSETLNGDTVTYSYDADNRLVQVAQGGVSTGYAYNPNGIRIGKTAGGVTTVYTVDENRDYAQVVVETTPAGAVVYTYGDDLISQDRDGVLSLYHYDGLGSTRLLSDAGGVVTDRYDYAAFGELLSQSGGTDNLYLFAGEQFDGASGLYYLRARYMIRGADGLRRWMLGWGVRTILRDHHKSHFCSTKSMHHIITLFISIRGEK